MFLILLGVAAALDWIPLSFGQFLCVALLYWLFD
jgi:hypothetical protein